MAGFVQYITAGVFFIRSNCVGLPDYIASNGDKLIHWCSLFSNYVLFAHANSILFNKCARLRQVRYILEPLFGIKRKNTIRAK